MAQKPDTAWEPSQVAAWLLQGIASGEFYILCEDNETTAQMDRKRILWAAQDITDGRPAPSRWHPDWADRFAAWFGPLISSARKPPQAAPLAPPRPPPSCAAGRPPQA